MSDDAARTPHRPRDSPGWREVKIIEREYLSLEDAAEDVAHIWWSTNYRDPPFTPVHSARVIGHELDMMVATGEYDEGVLAANLLHPLMHISSDHAEVNCQYCKEWIHA